MWQRILLAFLIFTMLVASFLFMGQCSKKASVFHGDSLGYYMYLPGVFIFNTIAFIDQLPADRSIEEPVLQNINIIKSNSVNSEKGHVVDQYTYGIAFMEAPFFLIAHQYEKVKGLPANGYSGNYNYMIKVSSFLYAMLGLMLVFMILKEYFSRSLSLITTVLVFLSTNLLWFTLYQAGMAHVPLFFLYALLILFTIRAHKKPREWIFVSIAIVAGFITLIRPTDVICLIIPFSYGVYSKETLRAKIAFIRQHRVKIVLATIAFFIPLIPQMLYWKALTGHYIFYSYGAQSFNWTQPKILEGLFYASNGWLFYSPIMIFSLLGLVLPRHFKNIAWCIWLLIPVYIYVIYSWYCYNYINGFGSRPMIHVYPLLAIPFAAFLNYIQGKGIIAQSIVALLILFFITMNISYSIQQAKGILNSEASNIAYNLQIMFRMQLNYDDLVVKDIGEMQPSRNKVKKLSTVACQTFDDSLSDHFEKGPPGSGFVYHFAEEEFHPGPISLSFDRKKYGNAKWFRCSGKFKCSVPPEYYKHLLVFSINRKGNYSLWKGCTIENKIGLIPEKEYQDIRPERFQPDMWWPVDFFVRIPDHAKDGDTMVLNVWNLGKRGIFIDDLCIETYE